MSRTTLAARDRTYAVLAAAALAAFCVSSSAGAQPAHLVKDIATDLSLAMSFPTNAGWMADLGGIVYFAADDGIHGEELWRTDGTSAGSYLVRDICPGLCSGVTFSEIRVSGGKLFFVADDGAHGRELWSSDGTASGTLLVTDLRPGLRGSWPAWLTSVGSQLFFTAQDPGQTQAPFGEQIYRVDTGSLAVAQVTTNAATSEYNLSVLGSGVFFVGCDPTSGCEPWFTDGSPGGTQMLGDLSPGAPNSMNYLQTPKQDEYLDAASLGNRVVFQVSSGPAIGMWSTDGTPAGTQLILAGTSNYLTRLGGRVFFDCQGVGISSGLCVTDGTVAGTQLVNDFGSGTGEVRISVGALGAELVFSLSQFGPTAMTQLWKTDGTGAGTVLLKDLGSGSLGSTGLFFGAAELNGRLYFYADDGTTGLEPWVTDGTAAGTGLLADLNPGTTGAAIWWMGSRFATVGGRAVFFADTPTTGWQLFTTDGTSLGTSLLRVVNAETSSLFLTIDSSPDFYGVAKYPVLAGDGRGNALLVAWTKNEGAEPWFTDGTAVGTHLVSDIAPGAAAGATLEPPAFASLGSKFVFQSLVSNTSTGRIGLTDGTEMGTEFVSLPDNSYGPIGMVPCNSGVFFDANSLWRSDGSVTGTGVVTPKALSSAACVGGRLVALVGSGSDLDLETTDGSVGGSAVVHSWGDGFPLYAPLAATESRWFFGVSDTSHGMELWTSDGTDAGTVLVADLNPGTADGIPNPWLVRFPGLPRLTPIVATRTRAFFVADDGTHGQEIWVSDGTAAGTFLLQDIYPGLRGSEPRQLVATRDRVYFVADDGIHGREVCTSDGTAAGTTLVRDLLPGADSSNPWDLRVIDDSLVFGATDGASGMELWTSHGSALSTHQIQNLAPGAESSTPMGFTRSGDRVYFYADDTVHGFEPWSFPVSVLGDDFFALAPCRVLDSRTAAPLSSGVPVTIPLVGHCGIPSTARAVVFTVTEVDPTAGGDIALFRSGDAIPVGGMVTAEAGRTRSGFAVLAIDPDGVVALARLQSPGTVHLVLDVSGYFE